MKILIVEDERELAKSMEAPGRTDERAHTGRTVFISWSDNA